jgi:hypothetical protein
MPSPCIPTLHSANYFPAGERCDRFRSLVTSSASVIAAYFAEWHGKSLIDREGEKIGNLEDVYVDVETDQPQFGTVKEGLFNRHLTFVPLSGIHIGPNGLQVTATNDEVRNAPDLDMHGEEMTQADEAALYHHFGQNYTPPSSESGLRLARRCGPRHDSGPDGPC